MGTREITISKNIKSCMHCSYNCTNRNSVNSTLVRVISSESVQKSDVFQWYFSFCAAHFDLTVFIAVSVAILIKVTGLHWTLETLTLGPLFLYKSLSQQTSKLHLFTGCMSAASSPGSIHNGIITYLKNFCTEKVCGGNWSEKAKCMFSVERVTAENVLLLTPANLQILSPFLLLVTDI